MTPLAVEEFSTEGEFLCRAGCVKAKRDNGHIFLPTTRAPLIADNTPSPQSLRDSSPQAGEQFKSTQLALFLSLRNDKTFGFVIATLQIISFLVIKTSAGNL